MVGYNSKGKTILQLGLVHRSLWKFDKDLKDSRNLRDDCEPVVCINIL
jgi:hypothetical protein